MPIRFDLDSPELATKYDHTIGQFEHGKSLVHALKLEPGERVLDVGCGTGELSAYASQLVQPRGTVVGIDPLPTRVALSSDKGPGFRAVVGRAEDLGAFEEASFDVVYMNSVLHWVEDKVRALREALRVLKPGGRLGANCQDLARPHRFVSWLAEAIREADLVDAAAASGSPSGLSEKRLQALMERVGFQKVRVEQRTFYESASSVEELFAMAKSASFGNFLSQFTPGQLSLIREKVAQKIEASGGLKQLVLERHFVYGFGAK